MGTIKGIAMLDKKRSPALPNLPTAEEQGTKDLVAYTWNAIFLPKGAPDAIVKKLNGSMLREGCVDELLLYYAPFFLGEGIGMANLPALPSLKSRQDWKIIEQGLIGEDFRLRLIKS